MAASEASPFRLTPLDHAMPGALIPKILFFPESITSDVSMMIDTFREGLSRTLKALPLLSGTVRVIDSKGALGVTAPWVTLDDIFQVKDLRNGGGLDYRDLKERHFSLKDLDMKIILPLAGLMKSEKTVMLVQMNIIKGGIIMALCLHHSFTDGNGTFSIARIWAACCRNDGSRLVTQEMVNRERLMRGWESASLDDIADCEMGQTEVTSSRGILAYIHTIVSN